MKIKLVNDGGMQLLRGINFPVIVKVESFHTMPGGSVSASVKSVELFGGGAGKDCLMLDEWLIPQSTFELWK